MYYHTQENEVLDYICFKHYGFTSGAVEKVLEENSRLAEYGSFLPAGLKIKLPKLEKMLQKPIVRILD
ncbi:MAG: tail protein X [Wolbachia endosymbiont of Xenopsylla cheopis]